MGDLAKNTAVGIHFSFKKGKEGPNAYVPMLRILKQSQLIKSPKHNQGSTVTLIL